jgi:ABC-type antimicrobial peptide transport system permease subunit
MESLIQSIRMLEDLLKEKLSAREEKEIRAELFMLQDELKKECVITNRLDTRSQNKVLH